MPEPVAVFSSEEISIEDLFNAIQEAGGYVLDLTRGEGQVSEGESNVWVFLKGNDLGELEEEYLAAASLRLGAEPRTYVVLDIGRGEQAEDLAINVVSAFARRWPVVVYDFEDSFFSIEELVAERRSGRHVFK